jgi:hypothetical protein
MDTEEKYLFDLMGFLVVKQVLSRSEVDELNALIDSYDLWRKAESGQEAAWLNDPNFMTVGRPAHVGRAVQALARASENDAVLAHARRSEVPLRPRARAADAARRKAARAAWRRRAVGSGAGVSVSRRRNVERARRAVVRSERRGP